MFGPGDELSTSLQLFWRVTPSMADWLITVFMKCVLFVPEEGGNTTKIFVYCWPPTDAVKVVDALRFDQVAVMVVVPGEMLLVASPPATIMAMLVRDDDQVACWVTSCVVPSGLIRVAVNCWLKPTLMTGAV